MVEISEDLNNPFINMNIENCIFFRIWSTYIYANGEFSANNLESTEKSPYVVVFNVSHLLLLFQNYELV